MSLRSKTFVLLIMIFGLYALVDNFVQHKMVYPAFESLEREEALNDMHRSLEALNRESRSFGESLYAWAQGDKAASFIAAGGATGSDPLTLQEFRSLDANLIAFTNSVGRVVWSRGRNLESGEQLELPEFAIGSSLADNTLLEARGTKGTVSGVLNTSAGPMIVAAQRVSASSGATGSVIMARQLNSSVVESLARQARVSFVAEPIGTDLAPDRQSALDAMAVGDSMHVAAGTDESTLMAYAAVPDINGQRALLLSAELPRSISLRGQSAIQYAQGSLLALAVFVLLVMVLGLEKMVLSRLTRISNFCRDMSKAGAEGRRLDDYGRDELRQLTEDINTMVAELEDKNSLLDEALAESQAATQAKSDFLAVMSHEIRTPMNGVLGMLGVLSNTQLNAEQYEHLAVAQESAENLLRLLNDILDFSKIEAGKLEIEEIEFSLPMLIEDNMRVCQLKAKEKGLELVTDVSADIPEMLVGDPGRVRQILSNLLNNAVKFTHQGYVAVSVSITEDHDNDMVVRISVQDSGIGIPTDRLDRLFKSFSQVDASTTRQYGGSGLGLAICSTLAEMMGGEVGVESEIGRGSTFWFTLKLKREQDSLKARPLPLSELKGHSVLIVDDSTINRRVMNLQLSKWGLLVAEAASGLEALQMLRSASQAGQPYDVCILDYIMPGLNGQELGQAILSDEQICNTRLVLVTSAGQRGDANKFHAMGYSAYLSKPVSQNQLVECVATVLSSDAPISPPRPPLVTKYSLAENQAGALKILLAEDNRVNQKVAVALLSRAGHMVEIVESGKAALEALMREKFDMVLMDCHMPEMDGFQATQQIRRMRNNVASIPIIAMTARAMEGDRQFCLDSGMDDYLPKPINPVELYAALDRQRYNLENRAELHEAAFDDAQFDRRERVKPEISLLGSGEKFGVDTEATNWDGSVSMPLEPINVADSISHVGDRAFWLELVEVFLEEMPQRMDVLQGWIDQGNAEEVENSAHSIKGSCAEMLAEPMRLAAQALEMAGREHELNTAHELLSELRARYGDLEKMLQQQQALVA